MKFSLPKIKLPRIAAPKLSLPRFSLPKLGLPKPALDRKTLVIGASALAVIGAGGATWVFVRPMLAKKPPQEIATTEPEKPAEAKPETKSPEAPAKPEGAPEASQKTEKPEAAHQGAEQDKAAEKHEEKKPEAEHAGGHEKAEGGEKESKEALAPLPPPDPPSEVEILIRRLQDIQERVAGGDAASFVEQPRLLRMIARKFLEAPPKPGRSGKTSTPSRSTSCPAAVRPWGARLSPRTRFPPPRSR